MVKSNMMSAFTDFLNAQLEQRRMSMRELARQAGFSATQVSDVINEKVPASTNFVLRVALALDEDPQHLLRLAGHLPATPPPTDLSCALNDAIRQLSDTQQRAVAVIVFALAGDRTERAPTVLPPRSGQMLEKEAAYSPDSPVSAEQPARQSMAVDEPDQELYQAFRRVLDLVWKIAPREERGHYFLQTAIEVMHQRERESRSE